MYSGFVLLNKINSTSVMQIFTALNRVVTSWIQSRTLESWYLLFLPLRYKIKYEYIRKHIKYLFGKMLQECPLDERHKRSSLCFYSQLTC